MKPMIEFTSECEYMGWYGTTSVARVHSLIIKDAFFLNINGPVTIKITCSKENRNISFENIGKFQLHLKMMPTQLCNEKVQVHGISRTGRKLMFSVKCLKIKR